MPGPKPGADGTWAHPIENFVSFKLTIVVTLLLTIIEAKFSPTFVQRFLSLNDEATLSKI